MTRQAGKVISPVATSTVTISTPRTVVQTISAAAASAVTILKQAGKTSSRTSTTTTTLRVDVGKAIAISGVTTVLVGAVKAYLVTVSIACSTAVSLLREIGKNIAIACLGTVSVDTGTAPPANVAHVGGPGFNLSFEQARDRRKLRSDLERAVLGIEDAAEEVAEVQPILAQAQTLMARVPQMDTEGLAAIVRQMNALLIEADRLYRENDEEEAALLLLN